MHCITLHRVLLPGGDRPADVLLPHYAGGRHQAVDVCVVSSLQGQLVEGASTIPGHALAHRYQQKWQKYGDACDREGISFLPAPVVNLSMTKTLVPTLPDDTIVLS